MYLSGSNETNIFVWDIRTTKQLRLYEDFHMSDVTQVRFHPIHRNHLFTGSVDGTICVFNIAENDNDEALVGGINVDDSVSQIGFFGVDSDCLYCLSHCERLSLWTTQGEKLWNLEDPRTVLGEVLSDPVDYLVTCRCPQKDHENHLGRTCRMIVGNRSGRIGIVECQLEAVERGDRSQQRPVSFGPIALLENGHESTVRSLEWMGQVVISAGEDARICLWNWNAITTENTTINNMNVSANNNNNGDKEKEEEKEEDDDIRHHHRKRKQPHHNSTMNRMQD